jgi:hypothetical protein
MIRELFNVGVPVARAQRAHYDKRPTAVAFVSVPIEGGSALFMVHPKKAEPQGWILPQCEIALNESPMMAVLRVMSEECGYKSTHFTSTALALHRVEVKARTPDDTYVQDGYDNRVRDYFVVGLQMKTWLPPPRLSPDNTNFFLAHGPNAAWEHFKLCRPEKQGLIVAAMRVAVFGKPPLLHGPRWRERLHYVQPQLVAE